MWHVAYFLRANAQVACIRIAVLLRLLCALSKGIQVGVAGLMSRRVGPCALLLRFGRAW